MLALEPYPANYARLVRHIQLNGLHDVIECYNTGISDAAGTAGMAMSKGNSGHARMVSEGKDSDVAVTNARCVLRRVRPGAAGCSAGGCGGL